jgi:hypothetical protein
VVLLVFPCSWRWPKTAAANETRNQCGAVCFGVLIVVCADVPVVALGADFQSDDARGALNRLPDSLNVFAVMPAPTVPQGDCLWVKTGYLEQCNSRKVTGSV